MLIASHTAAFVSAGTTLAKILKGAFLALPVSQDGRIFGGFEEVADFCANSARKAA
jgi:hypothetical protein